jgi:ATP-dependent Clp protease adapter protein ClpS
MNETEEVLDTETTDGTSTGEMPRVILFNDEVHTFDDVINQVIKANGAVGVTVSQAQAEGIAQEVHTKGKAIAYGGEMENCIVVSTILEEIALHTMIEM